MAKLEKLVGRRYDSLSLMKIDIELLTNKEVTSIIESDSERFEEMDYMIDFQIGNEIFTIFYLKDNAGRYYITEV